MISRRAILRLSLASCASVSLPPVTQADPHEDLPFIYAVDGIALGGADPVAYFNVGALRNGRPDLAAFWREAEWRFSSMANLAAFQLNPTVFAPRYGGYCAWSLAHGLLRPTDPESWLIDDGHLFLFHDMQLRDNWAVALPGIVVEANRRWPVLLG